MHRAVCFSVHPLSHRLQGDSYLPHCVPSRGGWTWAPSAIAPQMDVSTDIPFLRLRWARLHDRLSLFLVMKTAILCVCVLIFIFIVFFFFGFIFMVLVSDPR